ncbi:uncharacterized protein RHOBADRAFT_33211 [Rhodotorula graminis WP1]|uniref:RING-type domain-containing protein n=1 Tax=Rhodotorula graminis (strain WP1) TaxID=578459 RepID=A0A194SD37_RHOGW|nr:uncharacterized protein RHOBADRAFT_33211 [Rhodotorula graminis WP1]KPV78524.1 hypothetical protein RHOBADRAFT_33211 [Rhodotorula graminis WP1]
MSSSVLDDRQDEDSCPICLELLSLRLAGEKPHVVPVCGHRLHHSCFEAVYGDVQRAKSKTAGSLGLCGVCRRDMKVGDGGDGPSKTNKFAKLSGLPSATEPAPSFKMRSSSRGTHLDQRPPVRDVAQDDELTVSGGSRTGTSSSFDGVAELVKPVVTVRAEHPSVERSYERDKKQHLTCMVSVMMPSRYAPPAQFANLFAAAVSSSAPDSSPPTRAPPPAPLPVSGRAPSSSSLRSGDRSPTSSVYSAYAYGATGVASSSFAPVVQDLQTRMADWKGHSPEEFGQLKLYDTIHVRKDTATREFTVYLFDEAILCVTDDRRRAASKAISPTSTSSGGDGGGDKLRLKGRVYVRHIRSVADTSRGGDDLSLTIIMNDDALAEFVMLFKERTSLEVWRGQIEHLVAQNRRAMSPPSSAAFPETPASASMHHQLRDRKDVLSDISSSDQSNLTTFSGYSRTTTTSVGPSASVILEEDEGAMDEFGRFAELSAPGYGDANTSPYGSSSSVQQQQQQQRGAYAGAVSSLDSPRSFTPLDLMLILSIPPPGTGTLKLDILKNALEFVVAHVGPRTRLSIVTYSSGEGARASLRKTPFVAVGKLDGRARLDQVVRELGCAPEGLTSMLEHQEERVNVVTACNLALDIVLQRKVKSALTGMVLLNDGRDGAQKQQMDLVMARCEAANVPIHTLGWGRSHDPSSLWLLSNHSAGSYTFVKDFYDLRDALAGSIGGILSIAATNVRLHIKVPEKRWFRVRKVSGSPGAIVSKTGTDVDVEIGSLSFGERRDLIVEVELSLGPAGDSAGQRERSSDGTAPPPRAPEYSTATDAFFLSRAGVNPSAMDDFAASSSNLYEDAYDDMPDEAPVFEVNAAYRDPAAGKTVSRLNHSPCLLTITINPPSSSASFGRQPPPVSAPEIVRRRMELLVSDMLSRALLLMTRRNGAQAGRLLEETKRIISTISTTLVPASPHVGGSAAALARSQSARRRTSVAGAATTQRTLVALADDVDQAHEACLDRELFDTCGRYLTAQQAVVLRDQRAWTGKTPSERLVWRADNSLWLVAKSQAWLSSSSS